jgi:hypothetical protein
MRETLSAYRILVGNIEGRRVLGRPRCRYEYNIKKKFKDKARFGQHSPDVAKLG